jgi:hypothetical protein
MVRWGTILAFCPCSITGSGARLFAIGSKKMKRILLLTAAACALSTGAFADETLKIRVFAHGTNVQNAPVGDVDGHNLVLTKFAGLANMPDGTVSGVDFSSITEANPNGTGSIVLAYWGIKATDASTLWLRSDNTKAQFTPTSGHFEGPLTVVGGTGKYANATGNGNWIGERRAALVAGVAEAYNDLTITLTSGDQAAAAKAMLTKVIAAVKADKELALVKFQKGEDGFRQGDLYPYCIEMPSGKALSGPISVQAGTDVRTLKDTNGTAFALDQYNVMIKAADGQIVESAGYYFPKPGTLAPSFPKTSYIARIGDIYCGVGFYK